MASRVVTQTTIERVDRVLGGKRVLGVEPRSAMDWIGMIRDGIPAAAVESILSAVGLAQADLARALGIPERTLARRKREGVLNSEESAKVLRLARIVSRAQDVFEDPGVAVDWLKAPNAALQGSAPLNLLDTDIGAESVFDTLGRIEQGVFA